MDERVSSWEKQVGVCEDQWSYLFQILHHLFLTHVLCPVPGRVSGVVACVDLRAQAQKQLCAFDPADVGAVMQRRVASSFDFVYVVTIFDCFLNGCVLKCHEVGAKQVSWR